MPARLCSTGGGSQAGCSFRLPACLRFATATDPARSLSHRRGTLPRPAFWFQVETVLIPISREQGSKDRITLCVSSQVGCAMNCQFCFTGGLVRVWGWLLLWLGCGWVVGSLGWGGGGWVFGLGPTPSHPTTTTSNTHAPAPQAAWACRAA